MELTRDIQELWWDAWKSGGNEPYLAMSPFSPFARSALADTVYQRKKYGELLNKMHENRESCVDSESYHDQIQNAKSLNTLPIRLHQYFESFWRGIISHVTILNVQWWEPVLYSLRHMRSNVQIQIWLKRMRES